MEEGQRSLKALTLTIVNEVLEDLLAARLHGVMQQRAASCILQQDVCSLLVELHQLEHRHQSVFDGSRGRRPKTKTLALHSPCSGSQS